jgi:hypothetical protein
MLEDVVGYFIIAPLAASLVAGAVAAFWLAGPRPAMTHLLARIPHPRSRH